jgi:hypothetical protein
MKKLLLTTALAGATLVASNAIAQTTVSGNLDIAFKAISSEKASDAGNSHQGFGKEAQINIQTKGKLNNGMDYAAGFSLEDDGNTSGSSTGTNFNENTFIDFISGNTTITVGMDHIQNSDRTAANFLGLIAEDLTGTTHTGITTDGFLADVGADPAQSFGAGIMQKTPVGTFSAFYAPNNSRHTGVYGADDQASDTADESAYEIGFVGDLGVKGLNVHAFINEENKIGGDTRKVKGQNLGANYNFGQVTAGLNYKKSEYGKVADGTVSLGETDQIEYGLAYALTPNLTIGANYTKADNDHTSHVDAKSKSIAVGYNLGAVALTAQAAKLENYDFTSGTDADVLYLRASTKF